MNADHIFRCKEFQVIQEKNVMKVNSDGMLLGAWANGDNASKMLDIGTGTGIIALMLAQRYPEAEVHGIEIDETSAAEAKTNFQNSPWSNRMTLIEDAIQNYARITDEKYDLIVSNPPFFTGGTHSSNTNKSQVRHTIKLSHGDLLIAVHRLLSQEGRFEVILPYLEGERLIDMAKRYDLFEIEVTELQPSKDKPIERLLISMGRKSEAKADRKSLIMYEETKPHKKYSKEYIELTKGFYLKF